MKLYHYTDINGLKGIIDNSSLWATDIKFLNDSKELYAGIDKLEQTCSEPIDLKTIMFQGSQLNEHPNAEVIKAKITSAYSTICEVIKKNLENRDTYITSFSDKRDNLRQWMSYCPGNAGYCIVFDGHKLRKTEIEERDTGYVTNLERVHYGKSELTSILEPQNIIDNILKNNAKEAFVHKLTNRLMFHCCAIKPEEFYDESETRLIIQSTQARKHDTKFRIKSGVFIPYMTHIAPKESILEIIIGPNVNMELAELGLKHYLDKNEIDCPIYKSNCSLRVL